MAIVKAAIRRKLYEEVDDGRGGGRWGEDQRADRPQAVYHLKSQELWNKKEI